MTYNETEILIQKYLNGETTTEEERLLALEVSQENVPEDWKVIAEMLGELIVDEALFDQIMEERRRKPRLIKLWPWVAAACVAALLIVFLSPPREDSPSQPQVAKVGVEQKQDRQKVKVAEVKNVGQKAEKKQTHEEKPLQVKHRINTSKRVVKERVPDPQECSTDRELKEVEKDDIVPYEDPLMQFAEQSRALCERGNRVIQRVSMNGLPSNYYQLNDL